MAASTERPLAIMKPLGGGDPIPLRKPEMTLGRRPTCDVRLDFEKVSGRHCVLRLHKGVWHVRDLGSTNGTTINGQKIDRELAVLPDDELGIAGRYYRLDYDAAGSVSENSRILEEESVVETRKQHSLMELAGLVSDHSDPSPRRPDRPPSKIERPRAEEAEFDEPVPAKFDAPPVVADDDDFFRMIQGDLGDGEPKKRPKR